MINKATVLGNLGKDPEVRRLNSGDPVCNLSVATSESWRDKSTGEKREKTEWHNVVVFHEATVKFLENYAQKGTTVYVEGQLQTRKWTDQQGVEKFTTEIVVKFTNSVKIVKGGRETRQEQPRQAEQEREPLDDEIPF